MKALDANTAIVLAATTAFLSAYGYTATSTATAVSETFVVATRKWYDDHNMAFNPSEELLCDDAVEFACTTIAAAYNMAALVSKMMPPLDE